MNPHRELAIRLRRRRFLVALVAAATAAGVLSGVSHAESGPTSAMTLGAKYCVMVIGKADSPDKMSPVRYRYCSHKSEKDAEAHFSSPEARAKLGGDFQLSAETKLVEIFEYPNFEGFGFSIYGDDGPCDSSGYKIDVDATPLENALSSVKRANSHCNHAAYYDLDGPYANDAPVPTYRFGARLDNRIDYFQVCDGWCP